MTGAPATSARPRVPRAQRREQLLDVALDLLGRDGFGALTVDAVARGAGVDRVVVYRSFANLPQLLVALLRREQARVDRQVDALIPADVDGRHPAELLLEALSGFLTTVAHDPRTWRLALVAPEGAPATLRRLVARRRTATARRLVPLVRWGVGALAPSSPPLDEEVLARMLLTLAEEHGRLLLEGGPFTHERLMASATALLGAVAWRA